MTVAARSPVFAHDALALAARVLAVTLTHESMEMLRAGAKRAQVVEHKGMGDWATVLDRAIEDHLRARIAAAFPDHGFLGEEGGGVSATAIASDPRPVWVVDPIDGSVNFVRGYPQYAVSIALVVGGEPIAACIGDPNRGEVFSAARGHGAHCNGTPLRVAGTDTLDMAIAATVFPKPQAPFMDDYLARFGRVLRTTAGVRRAGSMALELAYLAAGRVDAFWQRGMGAWDAAAGVLLVREAGGEVFTLDGQPWLESAEVCAVVPGVSFAWLALLRDPLSAGCMSRSGRQPPIIPTPDPEKFHA